MRSEKACQPGSNQPAAALRISFQRQREVRITGTYCGWRLYIKKFERYNPDTHNPVNVKEILALASGHPTPKRLEDILIKFYTQQGHILFISSDSIKITGLIGIDHTASPHGWIVNLAVHPDFRMRDIGRGLIEQAIKTLSLKSVALTTDQDAVDFYRACGFQVTEIKSQWPDTRRYRCTKGQMPQFVLQYYENLKAP
ncbi:MAG: GNAT family N-acetyltransferase [Dehalococcoidales bacterium]|nr:GNAT family N-acetyltransferase [Dehalococcoidales bacterium]